MSRLILLVFLANALTGCQTTKTIAWWEKKGLEPKTYSRMLIYVNASSLPKKATLEYAVGEAFTMHGIEVMTASDALPAMIIDSTTDLRSLRSQLDSIKADVLLQIDYDKITKTTTNVSVNFNYGWYGTPGMWDQGTQEGSVAVNKLIDPADGSVLMIVETGRDIYEHASMSDVGFGLGRELVRQFKDRAITLSSKED